MIELFLIVTACLEPNYTDCHQLKAYDYTQESPHFCQLDRPYQAAAWQLWLDLGEEGNMGWRTFTRCQYVNPDQNGETG